MTMDYRATATVPSIPGYDFKTVRNLQDQCQSALIHNMEDSNDPNFIRIKRLIKDAKYESALQLLDAMIAHCEDNSLNLSELDLNLTSLGESESPCTIEQLLMTRADVHMKRKHRVKARNNAQLCILKKPNFMPAYHLLATIERRRKEYGQAELALRLGVHMSPGNKDLIQKRDSLLANFYPELPFMDSSRYNTRGSLIWQLYAKKNLELLQQKNGLIGQFRGCDQSEAIIAV